MNCLLILGIAECCITVHYSIENDFFWVYINSGLWLAVHLVFALVTIFRIIPNERSKLVRLTKPDELSVDNSNDTDYHKSVRMQEVYDRGSARHCSSYRAVFPS